MKDYPLRVAVLRATERDDDGIPTAGTWTAETIDIPGYTRNAPEALAEAAIAAYEKQHGGDDAWLGDVAYVFVTHLRDDRPVDDDDGPYNEVEYNGHVTVLNRFGDAVDEYDENEETEDESVN